MYLTFIDIVIGLNTQKPLQIQMNVCVVGTYFFNEIIKFNLLCRACSIHNVQKENNSIISTKKPVVFIDVHRLKLEFETKWPIFSMFSV